ncbi:phosphoglycolate phosphatase-like HAD superfamily hydrolase [Actinoplanes octamycinicus]|uniref:Phosphoglycolate phosphatase-like HAD superfamily hydrolase n=1 Tax=Actinoplanes octamycinicus TaxID=135948 RepID=A0A7W7GYU2_9ACTN|nr:HAD family hydrolase [Actinoplanes octamycinicus]MBB4740602.1 phosphoglycolate phosphatase-like HAD superfamily hydrolase [Actinoplanes octamycinicus]GIE63096.1 hypothetical protein Aoc01nite_84980 [Actinoplanes octamycinicus]
MGGLVIFDLDDTLLRTAAATRAARRTVLATLLPGCDVARALAIWRRTTLLYSDQQFADLVEVLAAVLGAPLPAGADLDGLAAEYHAEAVARVTVDPRVVAAARRLRGDGHALAIVSNGDDAAQRAKIDRCGLGELAPAERVVICDGTRIPRKPDPAGLRPLLGAAAPAVLVGDRTTDVLTARRAGIPVVRLRTRTADLERGSGLSRAVRADAECAPAGVYDAVRELL